MSKTYDPDREPLMNQQQPAPQVAPPAYTQGPPPPNNPYAPGYPPAQPGYPPAQPGYPPVQPVQQQQATTVVVAPTQPIIRMSGYNDQPVRGRCPNCQNEVLSQLDYVPGALTWLLVIVLFFFGFWLCFFIPLCIDSVKDVNHICPVCNYHLGTYKRM